ncbi:MAG: hypothetical protein M1819_006379 [Sarea resinae]|nr:MAG: hypothetical protein M1819_006379 [Sarea resinae]
MAEHSKACCTVPPVVTNNYEPKGTYEKVGDLNIYIYDVFGLFPSTLQGADRLASHLDCLVLVPDFFKGEPLQVSFFPPDTDEKKAKVQAFIEEKAGIEANLFVLLQTTELAKKRWPEVKSWGAFGLCWGGKVAALASGPDSPFQVSGQAHPGRLAKEDAEAMTIPHICLCSPDEPADIVKAYSDILTAPESGKVGEVELYGTMFHGWMGARADLKNEENVKEFERG